jgi:putative two-component system response regulator
MLHDIGKIAIPDSILLKPGSLSVSETLHMRCHTAIGAKILSGSNREVIRMAEVIALTHHKRWDGKGYPCSYAARRSRSGVGLPPFAM